MLQVLYMILRFVSARMKTTWEIIQTASSSSIQWILLRSVSDVYKHCLGTGSVSIRHSLVCLRSWSWAKSLFLAVSTAVCIIQMTGFLRSTWGPSGGERILVGTMLAPWILLSEYIRELYLNRAIDKNLKIYLTARLVFYTNVTLDYIYGWFRIEIHTYTTFGWKHTNTSVLKDGVWTAWLGMCMCFCGKVYTFRY